MAAAHIATHTCLIVHASGASISITKVSSRLSEQYHRQAVAGIDVTQDDAWESVQKAVAPRHIDVLILNAGILIKDDLAHLSFQQDTLLEQVSGLWRSSLWSSDALMAGLVI